MIESDQEVWIRFGIFAAVLAAVVFELILNACAMFAQAHIALPAGGRRPDLTRAESDARYASRASFHFAPRARQQLWLQSFGLEPSVRDRTAKPEKGHENMTIGLLTYQDGKSSRLLWSLTLPLRGRK